MLCSVPDPTLLDMPLVGTPMPMVVILGVYLLAVKVIGPAVMENRKPINPKSWIVYYNIYQIIANAILCYWVS